MDREELDVIFGELDIEPYDEDGDRGLVDDRGLSDLIDTNVPLGFGDVDMSGLTSQDVGRESAAFSALLTLQGMSSYQYGIFMYYIYCVMRKAQGIEAMDTSLVSRRDELQVEITRVTEQISTTNAAIQYLVRQLKNQAKEDSTQQVQIRKSEMLAAVQGHRKDHLALKDKLAKLNRQYDMTLVDVLTAPKPSSLMTDEMTVIDGWSRYAEAEYLQAAILPDMPVSRELQPLNLATDDANRYLSTKFSNIAMTPSDLLGIIANSSLPLPGYFNRDNLLLRITVNEGGRAIPTSEAVLLSNLSKASLQGEFVSQATLDQAIMGKGQYIVTPLMLEVANMNDLIKLGVNPVSWTQTTGRALSGFALQLFALWNGRGRKPLTTTVLMQTFRAVGLESTYSLPRTVAPRTFLSDIARKGKNEGDKKDAKPNAPDDKSDGS